MKQSIAFLMLAAAVTAGPTRAHAHGTFNMLLGSTQQSTGSPGSGGTLKLDYEFPSVSTLALSLSTGVPGGDAIFTGQEPSITLLQTNDLVTPSYVLDSGTDVTLVITGIDDGASIQIVNNDGTTTCTTGSPCNLANVGDSAKLGVVGSGAGQTLNPNNSENPDPHIHPTFSLTLQLDASAQVQYGEGRVSFKLTTSSSHYAESPIYTLKLSNGPLPHFDYDTAGYALNSVLCQQRVGLQMSLFISQELSALRACLDRVQVYVAKSVIIPPANPQKAAALATAVAAAQSAAEKACADQVHPTVPDSRTLLGKIATAQASAFGSIQLKCGTPGGTTITGKTIPTSASGDLDDNAIRQLLGLASCRAQEQAAAAYGGALDDLEAFTARVSQGALSLDSYFPCLYSTAAQ